MADPMHEMSLAESLVQIIAEQARIQHYTKVRKVRLEIGALGGVEPEAMAFCFDIVTRGTLADGAELEILNIPAKGWCLVCSKEVTIAQRFDPCPDCGGYQLHVTGGEELRIKDLEVD